MICSILVFIIAKYTCNFVWNHLRAQNSYNVTETEILFELRRNAKNGLLLLQRLHTARVINDIRGKIY